MDFIKEWAISLCIAFVSSAILGFIVPEGNMKKTADLIISIFMLAVIIVPLMSVNMYNSDFIDADIYEIPDEEVYIGEFNEFVVNNSKKIIEDELINFLKEYCSDEFYVEIDIENNNKETLVLNNIVIRVSYSDFKISERIKSDILQKFGIVPTIELME